MFVINPDPYNLPNYIISPFQNEDVGKNHSLPDSDLIDGYLKDRFAGKEFLYTYNGRKALNIAFGYYNLKKDDVVTVLTTSNNFYISSCVTKEIEKFCKWSREIEENTRLIYVNHEFGYPYEDMRGLLKYNVPIVEDCAHTFLSTDEKNEMGEIGDFVIYSFPKIFKLQIGGLLVSNLKGSINSDYRLEPDLLRYIKNVLSHYINDIDAISKKRIENHEFLKTKFSDFGFTPRFDLKPGTVPGVFMFRTGSLPLDLPELKKYFYAHGIQCSVFYGEEAFYIPSHQALNQMDMLYFYEVLKSFIEKDPLGSK